MNSRFKDNIPKMTIYCDSTINRIEMEKYNLSNKFQTRVTVHNLATLSPEYVFVAFMNAIDDLLFTDAEDYADGFHMHHEWTARECWERMHPKYKEQILAAIPDIQYYMEWRTAPNDSTPFVEFKINTFSRVVCFEKAEIIKRAQTKMLKEEIAMAVMHPDRIDRMNCQYGVDVLDFY